jgi:UDP-N-acetylmuramyl pentapeptide synthase
MMLDLKFEPAFINNKISTLRILPMRLELKYGLNDCIIIDDSYSADLLSLEAALEFFRQQESQKEKNLDYFCV